MLKNLVSNFYSEEYVPHVRHVLYPILMGAAGWKCLTVYQWEVFGALVVWGAALLFLVIVLGIAWRGPIEYWDKIESVTKVLLKINKPEVWYALGFKEIPSITIKEYIEPKTPNSLPTIHYTRTPAPNVVVLNTIANKVIMSQRTDFTEALYGNIVKGSGVKGGWAAFIDDFKKKGFAKKESAHPKAKHVLTHKGLQHLYQFADNAIKLQIEKEGKNAIEE